MSTAVLFSWWEIDCGTCKFLSKSEDEKNCWFVSIFIYFLIFSGENSHKTVFHGESFIYSREKK